MHPADARRTERARADCRAPPEAWRDINLQNSRGLTALNAAAYYGRERMVEMLLQHGAEIPRTALAAAAQGGQERVVDLLLRRGAEIDLQDKNGAPR